MAAADDQRILQHPGDRHRPARSGRLLPAKPYGTGDRLAPRLGRNHRQVLHQRPLEVRLGHLALQRQVLLSGLQDPQREASPPTTSRNRSRPPTSRDMGDRSYFDLRGYRARGPVRIRLQQAAAAWCCRCSTTTSTIAIAPDEIGTGSAVRSKIDAQFHRASRAPRQTTSRRACGCSTRRSRSTTSARPRCRPNPALPNFKPPTCFIRGVGGDYDRASR